ncbi:MAG: ankyrin repeat domain-containing protein [Chlamydiae bacterium]|nr:ankyrin repeat domain-containing protein [Chlamydiota bacterium]
MSISSSNSVGFIFHYSSISSEDGNDYSQEFSDYVEKEHADTPTTVHLSSISSCDSLSSLTTTFSKEQQQCVEKTFHALQTFPTNLDKHLVLLSIELRRGKKDDLSTMQTLTRCSPYAKDRALLVADVALATILLAAGARDIDRAMIAAGQRGDLTATALFLEKGANPDYQEPLILDNGVRSVEETLLFHAISMRKISLILLLLQHNANPNLQDAEGKTPLMYAIQKQYYDGILLLLQYDVNLELLDIYERAAKDYFAYMPFPAPSSLHYPKHATIRSIIVQKVNKEHILASSPSQQEGNSSSVIGARTIINRKQNLSSFSQPRAVSSSSFTDACIMS